MSKVNHPDHYNQLGIECIEVVRHFNFNRGNAIKYIWRAGLKGDAVEDLEKAIWYLRDEIGRIKEKPAVHNPLESVVNAFDNFGKALGQVAEIRYNDGTTKTIEAEPENLPAATPPQQENSQQDGLPTNTPEKQVEGLRNDSTLTDLGQISTAVMEALQKQTDWITGRDLAYKMNLKNSYQLRNRVQGELARFFKEGKVQRQKNNKQNVFEYKALPPDVMPETKMGRPEDANSQAQKILTYLKEAGKAMASREIVDELGIGMNVVAKSLHQFYVRGQLKRKEIDGVKGFFYYFSDDAEPVPVEKPAPTLSPNAQTVLDTLKKFDCLTFYTKICEAVDLPEIEVTKAIRELKVAKRISSPREKPMHYQVVS